MTSRILILAVCVAIAIPLVQSGEATEPRALQRPLEEFPHAIDEWVNYPTPAFDPEVVARLGVDSYLNRGYRAPDGNIALLYIGYYTSQQTGHRVHYPMSCLPGQGWEPVSVDAISLGGAGRDRPATMVNRYVVQKGLDRQVMLFWYQSHRRIVASEYWAKLYLAADAMFLNRSDSALVRIVTPVLSADADGVRDAEELGVRFVNAVRPTIDRYLPE